jgi:hypothetical protein
MQKEVVFSFSDLINSPECEDFFTAFWKLTNIPILSTYQKGICWVVILVAFSPIICYDVGKEVQMRK